MAAKGRGGRRAATAGPLDWEDVIRPKRPTDDELLKISRNNASLTTRRWLTPYHANGVTPQALERVLDRCRAEGIGVVLLGIPACTADRAEFTAEIEAEYIGYIHGLTKTFGCRWVDARDWMPDTLFLDDLHLRFEDGATVFTERFAREVLLQLPLSDATLHGKFTCRSAPGSQHDLSVSPVTSRRQLMKLVGTLFALVAVAGLASAEERKSDRGQAGRQMEDHGRDQERGQGRGGQPEGQVIFAKDTVTIKGADMTHVMSYKLDTTKSPIEINMEGKEGPRLARRRRGSSPWTGTH